MNRFVLVLGLSICVTGCGSDDGSGNGGGTGGSAAGSGSGGSGNGTSGGSGGTGTGGTGGSGTGGIGGVIGTNGGPQLLFTDLVSGPSSGNSDTSKGNGGAIVTVWGRGLGASQGSSTLRIGGVEAPIYEWRNADGPAADMYSKHGMQSVAFLVPSSVGAGVTSIEVTVDRTVTNTLPFTVRDQGEIVFVMANGSGSGNGSWSSPYGSMGDAVDAIDDGDIIYVGDGVTATQTHQFHGCVNFSRSGTADLPRAIVAYPGATVNVGGDNASCDSPFGNFAGEENKPAYHWVVSKLRALGGGDTAIPADTGYRLVGNYVSMNDPIDNCQSGAIGAQGNDVYILGNQITNTAKDNPTVSKLCHTIYLSGRRAMDESDCGGRCPTESNREVGWNLLNDNYDNRGINIYSEQEFAAFIEKHIVHDNYIINHRGDGILIGYYVTGENWFYNNVIVNTGLGPEWNGEISGHYALQINGGHESNQPTTLYVFNNTVVGGGFPENSDSAMVHWGPFGEATLEFRNNVVVSPDVPYFTEYSEDIPNGEGKNLWFGQSAAPGWNSGAITGDPMFVNAAGGDFHLQATSPAVDQGTATDLAIDFDGLLRPQGTAFDLGAFEYKAP
jgi:uncharacterized protein (TIGR03437 family)